MIFSLLRIITPVAIGFSYGFGRTHPYVVYVTRHTIRFYAEEVRKLWLVYSVSEVTREDSVSVVCCKSEKNGSGSTIIP